MRLCRLFLHRQTGLITLLMVAALAISACGNKGPLSHPAHQSATTR